MPDSPDPLERLQAAAQAVIATAKLHYTENLAVIDSDALEALVAALSTDEGNEDHG